MPTTSVRISDTPRPKRQHHKPLPRDVRTPAVSGKCPHSREVTAQLLRDIEKQRLPRQRTRSNLRHFDPRNRKVRGLRAETDGDRAANIAPRTGGAVVL